MLLNEADSPLIERVLDAYRTVSSALLRTELLRVGLRIGLVAGAERLLGPVALIPVDRELLELAATILPANVATLAAIHLATAVRLGDHLDAVMTYDARLADGARHHGLTVLAPT